MPVFITVTKCLLLNHIICQLSARLRQVYLTLTCTEDLMELPPGWGCPRCLVSSGCFWSLWGCTMYTPSDLIWLPYFIYSHPFGWLAHVDAAFSPSWIESRQQQTGTTQKRVSDSPLKCVFLFFFFCEAPLLPEDKIQRTLLFFLLIHHFNRLTPSDILQTSSSQNKSS